MESELNRFMPIPDGMKILSLPTGKEYYVYIVRTERSRQVLYVGMGTGDRLGDHKKHAFNLSGDKTNSYLRRTIRAFRLTQSQDVLCEKICESDDVEVIRETERYWIAKIGLRWLCNIADGGEYRGKMSDAEKRRARAKSRQSAFKQWGVDPDSVVGTVIGTRKIVALPDPGKWGKYHTVCLECGEKGTFTRERMKRRCLGCQRTEEQSNFARAVKELPLLLKDKFITTAKLQKLIAKHFHVAPDKVIATTLKNGTIIQDKRGNRLFHYVD